jgi:hypothetical protein
MKDVNGIEEPINPSTGRPYSARRRYARERDLDLLNHIQAIIINNLHVHVPNELIEEDWDYVNYEGVIEDLEALKKNIFYYKYHGGMATSEVIEDIRETNEVY